MMCSDSDPDIEHLSWSVYSLQSCVCEIRGKRFRTIKQLLDTHLVLCTDHFDDATCTPRERKNTFLPSGHRCRMKHGKRLCNHGGICLSFMRQSFLKASLTDCR